MERNVTKESPQDAFERRYMGRFREIASDYGVIAEYERDRAARDIGLHLFRKRKSGAEEATGSLVWFQMKGIMKATLSAPAFKTASHVSIRLNTADLKLWSRSNAPTYLLVYVESADTFLILDAVKYAKEHFGSELHTMKEKTLTVKVPTSNVLDDDAFNALLQRGSVEEWSRVLDAPEEDVRLCLRDFSVIWHIGTAEKRRVQQRFEVTDWQSKLRGEVDLQERPEDSSDDDEWESIRPHWQPYLRMEDVESAYPYLDFEPADEDFQSDCEWSNEDNNPFVELKDGTTLYGRDRSSEYNEYLLRPKLNKMGKRLFKLVLKLIEADLMDEPDGERSMISVAPWHRRL